MKIYSVMMYLPSVNDSDCRIKGGEVVDETKTLWKLGNGKSLRKTELGLSDFRVYPDAKPVADLNQLFLVLGGTFEASSEEEAIKKCKKEARDRISRLTEIL